MSEPAHPITVSPVATIDATSVADDARTDAAIDREAPPVTHATSVAITTPDAIARPRVAARPLSVSPVLSDSQPPGPARPRVHAQPPVFAAPLLRGPADGPRPAGAAHLDLTLPAAVAAQVAAPVAAAPVAAAPALAPVVAPLRVSTSALDIPAIAQAVHRHLERELRWERERKGGRT